MIQIKIKFLKKKITILNLGLFLFLTNCSPFTDTSLVKIDNLASKNISLSINDKGTTGSFERTELVEWQINSINFNNVLNYEVCLGTIYGECNELSWINVGTNQFYQFNQQLSPLTNYFVSVRFTTNDFEVSRVYSSSGFWTPANAVKIIKAGNSGLHFCAISRLNKLKCWGSNSAGQLGYDDTDNRGHLASSIENLANIDLGPNRTAKSVITGAYHTCAILDNDQVKCWGHNYAGQLGYGSTAIIGSNTGDMAGLGYVNLGSGRTAKSIGLGNSHSCVILDNDQLKCWGLNNYGQLGYDSTTNIGINIGDMAGLGYVNLGPGRSAKSVEAGELHTCVILDNDQVKCWGRNNSGRLGYDDATDRGGFPGSMASLNYVNLGSGRTAKSISLGVYHTCAILDNDQVKCWGDNWAGQLGYDSNSQVGNTFGSMAGLATINLGPGRSAKSIELGYDFTCVILDNDQVKCWGDNPNGQLGYNDEISRGGSPGDMAALNFLDFGVGRTVKSITSGHNFSCAILDNDELACWGGNGNGQLGYNNDSSFGTSFISLMSIPNHPYIPD